MMYECSNVHAEAERITFNSNKMLFFLFLSESKCIYLKLMANNHHQCRIELKMVFHFIPRIYYVHTYRTITLEWEFPRNAANVLQILFCGFPI